MEEGKKGKKEDPEEAHGMPVPGGAIDDDLPGFELARCVETNKGTDERCDAEKEMDGVGVGDEEEKVATGVGTKEDVFCG